MNIPYVTYLFFVKEICKDMKFFMFFSSHFESFLIRVKNFDKTKTKYKQTNKACRFFAINLSFSYLRFLGPCLTTRRYETAFVLHHFY